MRLLTPLVALLACALLAGCSLANFDVGAGCDERYGCPSGLWCDPTGHCAVASGASCEATETCPAGLLCTQNQCTPVADVTTVKPCPSGQTSDLDGVCAAPGYTISNGTVADAATQLLWQQSVPANPCPADAAQFGAGQCSWADAVTYCEGLDLGGPGWRLPALVELFSIVDLGATGGSNVDATAFPGTPPAAFWTATTDSSGYGYYVSFQTGGVGKDGKGSGRVVRCVR